MNRLLRAIAFMSLTSCLCSIGLQWLGLQQFEGLWIVFALVAASSALQSLRPMKSMAFTLWVFTCVTTAFLFPGYFETWQGLALTSLIIPLTQLIMFGIGVTLSLNDFQRICKSPLPVCLGIFLQFICMPLIALEITRLFNFDGDIAAGVILIGSVSGGMASNLMTCIAGGNVALSVTITSFSTLLSPIFTPLLMSRLAGQFISIDTTKMMLSILNMVIIPIIAGLFGNAILYSPRPLFNRRSSLIYFLAIGLVFTVCASFMAMIVDSQIIQGVALAGGVIIAVTTCKYLSLIANVNVHSIGRLLPRLSMIAICMVLMIVTAQTHEILISAGFTLIGAAMLHNALGYMAGYFGARGFGALAGWMAYAVGYHDRARNLISIADCRTMAFEVGMQNGGMATGLAIDVFHSHVVALPANVFGTWMNISGSLLANYWSGHPIGQDECQELALSRDLQTELAGRNASSMQ